MVVQKQSHAFGWNFFDQIVEWIGDNLEPEDVFDEKALSAWAEFNGYVPEQDAYNEQDL